MCAAHALLFGAIKLGVCFGFCFIRPGHEVLPVGDPVATVFVSSIALGGIFATLAGGLVQMAGIAMGLAGGSKSLISISHSSFVLTLLYLRRASVRIFLGFQLWTRHLRFSKKPILAQNAVQGMDL
jgi:hypothetical protein